MLGWGHPYFLVALVCAGLPVLIHFLTRARPRIVRFPTFHLLMEAGSGLQALDRLRTILLLCIRCLAVCALILTFAQPHLKAPAVVSAENELQNIVIIVDASLSMRAVEGGISLFSKAQAQAADVLRSLDQNTRVNIIYIKHRPNSILPVISQNHAALHEGLIAAKCSMEKGNPAAALSFAEQMLGGAGKVFVFSDFQHTDWASVDLESYPSFSLFLRPVSSKSVNNIGITAISVSPSNPVEGEIFKIKCTLFNSSPIRRQETVQLDLGGIIRSFEVELTPFSSGEAVFTFSHPVPGIFKGKASIGPDNLTADNNRFFQVPVRTNLNVLVISDTDREANNSNAFFLSTALSPSNRVNTGIKVERRLSGEVDRTILETADVFFLADPVDLGSESLELIASRVINGTSFVYFMTNYSAPEVIAALGEASSGSITPPYSLLNIINVHSRDEGSVKIPIIQNSPLPILNTPDQGDLASIYFSSHYLTEIDHKRKDEILLLHKDGSAALSLSQTAKGKAIFANLPIASDNTDFAGSPLFPVLIHELMAALRSGETGKTNHPGEQWSLVFPGKWTINEFKKNSIINGPDERLISAEIYSSASGIRVVFPDSDLPGFYTIKQHNKTIAMGVVNINSRESDTRLLALRSLIEQQSSGASVAVVNDEGELLLIGRRKELWPWCLGALAFFLFSEMGLLAKWQTNKKGQSKK
jgi:hypothetical protein